MRAAILSLVVLALCAIAYGQDCPANEVYYTCGTTCPRTCANAGTPITNCDAGCVVGCFCAENFVRNSANVCVRPWDCNKDSFAQRRRK